MVFTKTVEKLYKAQMFTRYDDEGLVYYFSPEDFPGLEAEPYCFASSLGHTLKGYFYSYQGFNPNRLVVFDHGLGGGHRSYMKEIEMLCRQGYLVFSYDHTGCMESGGENIRGFAQSLRDLDDCLKALKADEKVNTAHIFLVGHSCGGFAVMNIPALHPDVEKLVVLSGLVSVEKILEQYFSGMLSGFRKDIMELETSSNPYYVKFSGEKSLANTNARVLLIHSDNDPTVHKEAHYDVLYSALKNRSNVEFMLVSGKGHNPNCTAQAVGLLGELSAALVKGRKLKTPKEKEAFKNSFDWDKITEQDKAVWYKIFAFLE